MATQDSAIQRPQDLGLSRRLSLAAGPLLFLVFYSLPVLGLHWEARGAIGILMWMVTWWVFTPVALPVTALLPVVAMAVGLASPDEILGSYFNDVVVLILGANMITAAWHTWGLDRRIALLFLAGAGPSVRHQILVWFSVAVVASMFFPNVIVAATLMPIAVSLLSYAGIFPQAIRTSGIATSILLAITWGANVGGMGTPLGGAMNLMAIKFIEQMITGREFMFWMWIPRMLPFVGVIYMVVAAYLLHFKRESDYFPGTRQFFRGQLKALGPMQTGERWGLVVFLACGLLTFLRPLYDDLLPNLQPAYVFLIGGLATFVLPAKPGRPVNRWEDVEPKLMWGLLYLIAGGLALGRLISSAAVGNLVSGWLSTSLTTNRLALTAVSGALAAVASNVTSNTAATAIIIPIVIRIAQALGVNPIGYVYLTTAAANISFMLPTSATGAVAAAHSLDPRSMFLRGSVLAVASTAVVVAMGYILLLFWPGFAVA